MAKTTTLEALHKRLIEIRTRKDLKLKPNPYLRKTIIGFDGIERPLELRYYQVQGILHMASMKQFLLGDDTGTGKTAMSIATLCYLWQNDPTLKTIILTTKSMTGQWASEFDKFADSSKFQVFVAKGTPASRQKTYKAFQAINDTPAILIMGYASARQDYKHMQAWEGFVLITDEAAAYKSPKSQTHQVVKHLAMKADRVYALTATLIKNNLIEGYGIYSVVVPDLFPKTVNQFMSEYCVTRMQRLPNSNRQVPIVVGYRRDQVERFRAKIDPYFLSRAKHDIASELPPLTIQERYVGLTKAQRDKYQEAVEGLLTIDKTGADKETTQLTALIYCQQIVNHPSLIDCDGDSEKMSELFDLITNGDLAEEKVVVFSRFIKMVDLLDAEAKRLKIPTVRITGAEDEAKGQRTEAMRKFQDPNSDVRVCWITMAAAEGINLQAAKAIVFYDSPWSAGDYLQLLGRIIRIGSVHDRCLAYHLVAEGTIDEKVIAMLRKKMKLIDQIMGKRLKGEKDDIIVSQENDISSLYNEMLGLKAPERPALQPIEI